MGSELINYLFPAT